MNWRAISAGILLSASLTTGALPAAALSSQYDLNNLSQDTEALNLSDDGGLVVAQRVKSRWVNRRVENRQQKRRFKKVCTTKRIRVRGNRGRKGRIRVVKECRLVRVRRFS